MKKVLRSLVVLSVILISACRAETDDIDRGNGDEARAYVDGIYTARGDEWDYGIEEATVVVSEGRIEEVFLLRLDKEGNDVTQNYVGQEVNGQQFPDLVQASEDMASDMINNQSYDVDSIAGATITADNWKVAARRALEGAAGAAE